MEPSAHPSHSPENEHSARSKIRFDEYVLDEARGELRRNDELVKLKPQPFLLLAMLARRADEIVTREEIQAALWRGDTFVDFDLGINSCIRQIRQALHDDAERPRYVQTVPRRGYRFIATVVRGRSVQSPTAGDTEMSVADNARAARPSSRSLSVALAVAVGLTSLLGAMVVWISFFSSGGSSGTSTGPVRVSVNVDKPMDAAGQALAISPDGTRIALVAGENAEHQLYLRPIGVTQATPLPGTEGARDPAFSPDGEWIAFFTENDLKKVSIRGGAPLTIFGGRGGKGLSWGVKGNIVFSRSVGDPLYEISAQGGEPRAVTRLEGSESSHQWPQILPDGKTVLFSVFHGGGVDAADVAVVDLDTGERRILDVPRGLARYLDAGYILVSTTSGFLVAHFDATSNEVVGELTSVPLDVHMNPSGGDMPFAVANNGTLVYLARIREAGHLLYIDRAGRRARLTAKEGWYYHPRYSPDGRRLSLTVLEDGWFNVWIFEIERQSWTRLTFEGNNYFGVWSPDGQWIAFASDRDGTRGRVFLESADGEGDARLVLDQAGTFPVSWSPQSGRLIVASLHEGQHLDLSELDMDGEGARTPQPLVSTRHSERNAFVSPDGRWLTYDSDESGTREVYVRSYPDPTRRWTLSRNGGARPAWSPIGDEVFFVEDGHMVSVEVGSGRELTPTKPKVLFEMEPVQRLMGVSNFDVAPDGQGFVTVWPSEPARASEIKVVLGWFDELERRVAGSR